MPMSKDNIPEGIFDPIFFENKENLSNFEFDPSSVMSSPAAQLRLKEAQRAIENSAAARGNVFSGGTLSALQDRSQQIASDEFGNEFNRQLAAFGMNKDVSNENFNRGITRFNTGRATQGDVFGRLADLIRLGQGASGTASSGIGNAGNQISQLQHNSGLNNAAGIQGMNQTLQGGLNNLAFYLNRQNP